MALLVAVVLTACESGPSPQEQASIAAEEARYAACLDLAGDIAATLQSYVDQFAPQLEGGVGTEIPAVEDLQAAAEEFRRRRSAAGCRAREFQLLLNRSLADLEGEGPLARAVVGRVRDEVAPVTGPAASVTVEVGDDLAAAVHDAGPGALIQLAPGRHELDEPLVLLREARIVGGGAPTTSIVSSAPGAVLLYAGDDRLTLTGVTLGHEGDESASVLVVPSGSLELRDVVVRGGVTDAAGSAGWGIVLGAGASSEGAASEQLLDGLVAEGNQAGGVAVTGGAPTLRDVRSTGNGGCGICWLEGAAGTLSEAELHDNEVGLSLTGASAPSVTDLTATGNQRAGVVIEGSDDGAEFEDLALRDNGAVGMVVRGDATPRIAGVVIDGHDEAGVVVEGASVPSVTGLEVRGGAVGLLVREEAAPEVVEVTVADVVDAHVVFAGDSGGSLRDVTCSAAAPGIVLLGATSVDVSEAGCEVVDQRD